MEAKLTFVAYYVHFVCVSSASRFILVRIDLRGKKEISLQLLSLEKASATSGGKLSYFCLAIRNLAILNFVDKENMQYNIIVYLIM